MTTLPNFEWDPKKAARNLRDHKVSFDEAVTSFFDLNAITYPDESHSSPGDERVINLGLSAGCPIHARSLRMGGVVKF